MFLIVELRRCVASENGLGQEGCIVSLALEIEGSLQVLFDKLVAWTVSVHFGPDFLLYISLYISCKSMALVFVKVGVLLRSPIELDVIICIGHVPFKLNSIVYKSLLSPHVDLRY